jgi:hypothetical protein
MIESSAVGVFYKRSRWHSTESAVAGVAYDALDSGWMSEVVPNDTFNEGDRVLKITITVEVME